MTTTDQTLTACPACGRDNVPGDRCHHCGRRDTTTPPYQLLTREMIAEQGVNGLRVQLMRNNSDWPLHRDQCEWLLEQVVEAVVVRNAANAMADYIATETFVVRDDPDFGECILMSIGSKRRLTNLAYVVLGMQPDGAAE